MPKLRHFKKRQRGRTRVSLSSRDDSGILSFPNVARGAFNRSTTLAESGTVSLDSAAGAATPIQLIAHINNHCGASQCRMLSSLKGVNFIAAWRCARSGDKPRAVRSMRRIIDESPPRREAVGPRRSRQVDRSLRDRNSGHGVTRLQIAPSCQEPSPAPVMRPTKPPVPRSLSRSPTV